MNKGPDYNRIAQNYDDARPPVGIDLILRALDGSRTPLSSMRLLDAGCGTGGYSLALAEHVQSVIGLDLSAGMLARSEKKRRKSNRRGQLAFVNGTMANTPFRDACFDGIMANQTLHHLGDAQAQGFEVHRKALREFARVLKPNGVIFISTSSQEQIVNGFWFYRLIPAAARRLQQRFIPLPELTAALGELGFDHVQQQVPSDLVLQGHAYFDAKGPLRAGWRDGDSAWSLASEKELAHALSVVHALDGRGELRTEVERWDAARRRSGQVTFVCASRNPCSGWSTGSGKT